MEARKGREGGRREDGTQGLGRANRGGGVVDWQLDPAGRVVKGRDETRPDHTEKGMAGGQGVCAWVSVLCMDEERIVLC